MLRLINSMVLCAFTLVMGIFFYSEAISPALGQETEQEMTVPETSTFTYTGCATTDQFREVILEFGGKLLSFGETGSGLVSLVGFPDGTFALFIYMSNIDMVCVLSTGDWSTMTSPAV